MGSFFPKNASGEAILRSNQKGGKRHQDNDRILAIFALKAASQFTANLYRRRAQINERMAQKYVLSKGTDLDFITPTTMRLFGLFLDDPLQEYYEREAARLTHVSRGSASKILRHLASLEFLTVRTSGRLKLYQLNLSSPVARQFKITKNIFSITELLKSLRPNTGRIVLFGSSSQGNDAKDSDVDLFILASGTKNEIREAIRQFNSGAERKVSPIVVNANESAKLKHEDKALYENIERGIELWRAE